ncbi:coiled-coil domain-containing protein 115 [Leguminivora glycinivorella]|uniref:coiled-coil domain-containing protein 115 n=1 Tax=Leguminivora glycinivorella TaxID=1035111 RepID=UPI00200FCD25|nr:coiled-coil domain-containing protein 115 [Leguminivora glycinivorella]
MELTEGNTLSLEAVSVLLDKLALKQLHLMEEKMQNVINVETRIHEGSIHLAKSRYIMGQTSVSTARLPTESSPEFSASVLVQSSEHQQFQVVENKAEDTINPLKWFGILVPQNMHKAREIFQNTVRYVVECAGIQYQIHQNMTDFGILQRYKEYVKSV